MSFRTLTDDETKAWPILVADITYTGPEPYPYRIYTNAAMDHVAYLGAGVRGSLAIGIPPGADFRKPCPPGHNPFYYDVYRALHTLKEASTMPTVKSSTPTSSWDQVLFALKYNSPRILLYGPPGTGKTKTAYLAAQAAGWHCLSTTLTEDTPMTELRGHFVLKGNEFVWHDGLIARAWRLSISKPVMVILNEIDHASGDTSTFLHNALDDPEMASMDMPNDETLRPMADRVVYVATMNGTPDDLSLALRDRFPVKIHLDTVNPDAVKALPKNLQVIGANLGAHEGLTLRGLYEFGRLAKYSLDQSTSAQVIFGAAAPDFLNALKLADTPKA